MLNFIYSASSALCHDPLVQARKQADAGGSSRSRVGGQGSGPETQIHTAFCRAWHIVGVQGWAAIWTKNCTKAHAVPAAIQLQGASRTSSRIGASFLPCGWLTRVFFYHHCWLCWAPGRWARAALPAWRAGSSLPCRLPLPSTGSVFVAPGSAALAIRGSSRPGIELCVPRTSRQVLPTLPPGKS